MVDSVKFIKTSVQTNKEGYVEQKTDDKLSDMGVLMSDKFTNFFIEKVKDAYSFDEEVLAKVRERIKDIKIFVQNLDGNDGLFEFDNDKIINVARKYFYGYKVDESNRSLLPVIKIETFGEFVNSLGHEFSHACAYSYETKKNRNGRTGAKVRNLSINNEVVSKKTRNGLFSVNNIAMEGLNSIITAKDFGNDSQSYFAGMLGCVVLPVVMGFNNLKKANVLNPDKINEVVNNLSGAKDWFGKIDLISRMHVAYSKRLKDPKLERLTDYFCCKMDEIEELISRIVVTDLIIPTLIKEPNSILRRDKVVEFMRNSNDFHLQMDNLIMFGMVLNKDETFKEYKKTTQERYEEYVSKNKERVYKLVYDGVIPALRNDNGEVFSYAMTREIIGISEYMKMPKESREAYDEYVASVCENCEGKLEFDSKFVISQTPRMTGRLMPDEKGIKNFSMFEYVASKNGYMVNNIEMHSSNKTIRCGIEKVPERDEENAFSLFQDLALKAFQLYEGDVNFANPELEY